MVQEDKGPVMGPDDERSGNQPVGEEATSLSVRRARLRGSLAKESSGAGGQPSEQLVSNTSQNAVLSDNMTEGDWVEHLDQLACAPTSNQQATNNDTSTLLSAAIISSHIVNNQATSPTVSAKTAVNKAEAKEDTECQGANAQAQALELLGNIDEAMGACATNLAVLQKIAGEQTDALKDLAETLTHQTFTEIGLNLNSLMESLNAALLPMQSMGELVPALDQLVAAIQAKQVDVGETKLSPEVLATNLADQLSEGLIDPSTFKCAYMAIYPADQPADLLHRLVNLLGAQRLSGELFRAAYEAIQAVQEPSAANPTLTASGVETLVDKAIAEELRQISAKREDELTELLAAKDKELSSAQAMLDARLQELNSQYEALKASLEERELALRDRAALISQKDSQIQQLKAQMEELQDETKSLVADLQKQLTEQKAENEEVSAPAKPTANFFDVAPSQPANLFETGPVKSLFQQASDQSAGSYTNNANDSSNRQSVPNQPASPMPITKQLPQEQKLAETRAGIAATKPQTTGGETVTQTNRPTQPSPSSATSNPFIAGAGSYGSGVRAQVFEVIVRQALAGAPWKEICAGPMQVNNISSEEVEAEVKRRQALLKK